MRRLILLFLLLIPGSLLANERDVLTAVTAHLVTQEAGSRPYWRYVWLQPGTQVTTVDVDYAMNAAMSKVRALIRGIPVGANCLAYRLDEFEPLSPDRLAGAWDALAVRDPVFHVTKDLQGGEEEDRKSIAILAPALRSYVAENITGGEDERLDVIAASLAESVAPVFEARFLLNEILDRSYYSMRDLAVGDELSQVAAKRGFFIGETKKVIGQRADFLIRSKITGDQRVVVSFPGLGGGTPAMITYDLFDGVTEPDKQLIRNLADFYKVADGNEIFFPMPNGMIEFLLVNGESELVDVAPSNLAVDTTKPRGHDTDLRPAISCISCHSEADGVSMYRAITDQFDTVPLAADPVTRSELDMIYRGDLDLPDGILGRARRDYAIAVAPLCGTEDGAIEAMHQHLAAVVYAYRYNLIDATAAAIELSLPEGKKVADFIRLPESALTDPEVAQAVAGVPLPRKSWNNIHTILAANLLPVKEEETSE